MRLNFFATIRYGVAAYGLVLEALYPFTSLPFAISISDELQESLKFQANIVNYFSAVCSFSFLVMFAYFMGFMLTIHGFIRLVMHYRPQFREKVEKRMAQKALKDKEQNKKRPSKRAVWGGLAWNISFSIAMIINDAIFNRNEDAASWKDGAIDRFQYLLDHVMTIIYFQLAMYSVLIGFAVLFSVTRRLVQARRQRRAAAAHEASREPVSEMAEVEAEGKKDGFVLEEKLIDFSDGMDSMYEKIETYAAPPPAESQEPLIRL